MVKLDQSKSALKNFYWLPQPGNDLSDEWQKIETLFTFLEIYRPTEYLWIFSSYIDLYFTIVQLFIQFSFVKNFET